MVTIASNINRHRAMKWWVRCAGPVTGTNFMKTKQEAARKIADSVIRLLERQKEFNHWWTDLKHEDQREILIDFEEIVLRLFE